MISGAVLCPAPPLLLPGATGGAVTEVEEIREHCLAALRQLVAQVPDRIVLVGAAGAGEAVGTPSPTWARSDDRVAPTTRSDGRVAATTRSDGRVAATTRSDGRVAPTTRSDGRVAPTTRSDGRVAPTTRSATTGTNHQSAPVMPISLGVGLTLMDRAGIAGGRVEVCSVPADLGPADAAELGTELVAGPDRVGLIVLADGSARRRTTSPGYRDERAIPFDQRVEAALVAVDTGALLDLDPQLAADLWVSGRVGWQVLAGAFRGEQLQANLRYSDDPFGVWYAVIDWAPQ